MQASSTSPSGTPVLPRPYSTALQRVHCIPCKDHARGLSVFFLMQGAQLVVTLFHFPCHFSNTRSLFLRFVPKPWMNVEATSLWLYFPYFFLLRSGSLSLSHLSFVLVVHHACFIGRPNSCGALICTMTSITSRSHSVITTRLPGIYHLLLFNWLVRGFLFSQRESRRVLFLFRLLMHNPDHLSFSFVPFGA